MLEECASNQTLKDIELEEKKHAENLPKRMLRTRAAMVGLYQGSLLAMPGEPVPRTMCTMNLYLEQTGTETLPSIMPEDSSIKRTKNIL